MALIEAGRSELTDAPKITNIEAYIAEGWNIAGYSHAPLSLIPGEDREQRLALYIQEGIQTQLEARDHAERISATAQSAEPYSLNAGTFFAITHIIARGQRAELDLLLPHLEMGRDLARRGLGLTALEGATTQPETQIGALGLLRATREFAPGLIKEDRLVRFVDFARPFVRAEIKRYTSHQKNYPFDHYSASLLYAIREYVPGVDGRFGDVVNRALRLPDIPNPALPPAQESTPVAPKVSIVMNPAKLLVPDPANYEERLATLLNESVQMLEPSQIHAIRQSNGMNDGRPYTPDEIVRESDEVRSVREVTALLQTGYEGMRTGPYGPALSTLHDEGRNYS